MSIPIMRVIVIDPFKLEIRYDVVQNPKLTQDYISFNEEIYKLMSDGPINVDVIEQAQLQTKDAKLRDSILVDENGLFNNPVEQKFFTVEGAYPQPLAGIGVVTGSDVNGNTVETSLSLKWFKERVKFYTLDDLTKIYGLWLR
jgi:hypothetical protein